MVRGEVFVVTRRTRSFFRCIGAVGWLIGAAPWLSAAEPVETRLEALTEQNRRLQEQVKNQQQQIDELRALVTGLNRNGERQDKELGDLRTQVGKETVLPPPHSTASGPEVRLTGEAGFGFFRTGAAGFSPNSEFRVDDAKVFLEGAVMRDVYLFAGLELVTREASDEYFHVGELYADFENVGASWGWSGLLNVRAGRFNLPFGEEYQRRNMLDNPLISHSVADIWGIDEGLEIYGAADRFSYVLAVQNGGHKTLRDYDADKSVVARVSFDPVSWAHLSASAMRTGDLTAAGDGSSEVWLANGFFRAIGAPSTTTKFSASLMELDGSAHWTGGDLRAAVGEARYDDNDLAGDNARRMRYFSVEGTQQFAGKWYGAARWSALRAPGGYPLVGLGDFGIFVFRSPLTRDLRRFSVGLGYRFGPSLLWKSEYAVERGELMNGVHRDHEDLLSSEIALRF